MIIIGRSNYLDFLSKFGVGGAHPGGIGLTKEILKTEEINETSRILDVGCGTGQTAAYLAEQYGAKVTGLDINPIMVEKAKSRMKKYQLPVEIIQGSIEKFPVKDGKFDFIISESVLSFVNKPKALKEIFRLLKSGGRFIANELTTNKRLSPTIEEEVKQFYGLDSVLMEKNWLTLFEQTDFKNIKIQMQKQSMLQSNTNPEFQYSEYIDPELYAVMYEHFNLIEKYEDVLGYRIFSCTK
ncbi:class I SAM-dependent methyltransferase [Bacillus cihuensis]|uniref:class I SAM-dependent methyltransferase n=1 Tax=Bacillus cihuensis TaxID=1208599 RepID=UPI0009FE49EB|nr:methyltransferase domain-containing protein [Bacillus cihuensis]